MTFKLFSACATMQTFSANCVYLGVPGKGKSTCCAVADQGSWKYAAANCLLRPHCWLLSSRRHAMVSRHGSDSEGSDRSHVPCRESC